MLGPQRALKVIEVAKILTRPEKVVCSLAGLLYVLEVVEVDGRMAKFARDVTIVGVNINVPWREVVDDDIEKLGG